jgi:hypothetical protein
MTEDRTNHSTTAPTPGATPRPDAGAIASGDFSPEQQREMARWLVEDGYDRAAVDEALAAAGLDPLPKEENLSPEAAAIDQLFPPAKKPEEYVMPVLAEGEYGTEVQAFDQQARGWLAEARFPRELGSSIAKAAQGEALKLETMDGTGRELWAREQRVMLQRLWGNKFEAKQAVARQLVQELEAKSPGLVRFLEETGLTNSATLAAQLALQGERLAARRAR